MIVARTNCNGTLGHLARTLHLVRELAVRGHRTTLLLDHAAPAVPAGWLDGLAVAALYDEGAGYRDESDDAARCLALLAAEDVALVVVDDYRLGRDWERALGALGAPLVAIDDLARGHAADLVVVPGLERDAAEPTRRGGRFLGGTAYVMLDPLCAAAHDGDVTGEGGASNADDASGDDRARRAVGDARAEGEPRVLLSLGGGGDLARLAALVGAVLDALDADTARRGGPRPRLQAVIGPQAHGAEPLLALARRRPDAIELLGDASSLGPALRGASLFVGAAGSAVYECAACKVPAITFPISGDQRGTRRALERIGHHLHLDALEDVELPALGRLVVAALGALPRLRALRAAAEERVDGRGAARVADALEALLGAAAPPAVAPTARLEDPDGTQGGDRCGHDDARAGSDEAARGAGGPVTADDPAADADARGAGDAFRVIACDDRDINRYLDARNLAANRRNMTDATPIGRLEHYLWWLTTSRASWRVERGGRTELYIWHRTVRAAGLEALIGGWFVARETSDIATVVAALRWQLARSDRERPDLPWLAVIRRGNDFTLRMNRAAGFVEAAPDGPEARAVAALFPNASREDFHHLLRPPVTASAVAPDANG